MLAAAFEEVGFGFCLQCHHTYVGLRKSVTGEIHTISETTTTQSAEGEKAIYFLLDAQDRVEIYLVGVICCSRVFSVPITRTLPPLKRLSTPFGYEG